MADTFQRKELQRVLNDFYHQPIAQVSLELFLTIGAVIFFAIFAIRPTIVTIAELNQEIEDKQELDQQLSDKVTALSSVQQQYLQLQDRLPVLDQALPNQPQLQRTIKIIEKLASEEELVIESLRVPEIPSENSSEVDAAPADQLERVGIPLLISVQGDYESIRAFVEAMRQVRRSILVDTITFSIQEERGSRVLTATITIDTQFFTTTSQAATLQEEDS